MNSAHPSEPPEEAHYRNEPHLLSPASPKPIHFPAPTNIPVLEMQMDVGFNQTEAHMNDPAMHNTDVRPDFWRDPAEQEQQQQQLQEEEQSGKHDEEHASPYSTGGDEAAEEVKEDGTNAGISPSDAQAAAEATSEEGATDTHAQPTSSNSYVPAGAEDVALQSHDPRLPSDEAQPEQERSASTFNQSSVDVNALLNTLHADPITASNSAANLDSPNTQAQQSLPPAHDSSPTSASAAGLGVPPSGLPPRPPPQEQPLIHPNYVHSQHIRDYHPHAAHPAFHSGQGHDTQGTVADPTNRNYVPPVAVSPSIANAAAAAAQSPAGISGTFFPQQTSPTSATPSAPGQAFHASTSATHPYAANTPIESRRERVLAAGQTPTAEDRPWDASVQRKYDGFIEAERSYVSEGRWEQFPPGSRLFVGNLSSEKVTKRDIFHVFHPYGDLAQISIKQAYGFVQFLRSDDCSRALEGEQGTQIRDKRIHLEVSKPQKNRPQANTNNNNNNAVRRSRSPEFGGRGKPPANVDRYVSGNNRNGGRRDPPHRGGGYRSPSPPRGGYRDRYDDRYRARSPDYGRGARYRSPSPVRRSEDDELPLPKRAPRDVPDVQILVLDSLERDFISWVEKAFSSRGVRVDVLLLSPRLSEQAVVRRQIVEGVVAVSKLTRANQQTGKIGLQIFDRRQGGAVGNVSFEEYDGLDPSICVELVLRAKSTHAAPPPTPSYGGYGGQYAPPSAPPAQYGYGAGQYGSQQPPAYQHNPYGQPAPLPPPPTAATAPPNLQNLITSLDPNGLQSLLSAMNQQQQTPQTAGSGMYGVTPSQPGSAQFAPPGHFGQQQAQAQAMAALQQNPALAGMLSQHQGKAQAGGAQGQPQGQVNMQDILARLGTYNKQ